MHKKIIFLENLKGPRKYKLIADEAHKIYIYIYI